MAKRVIFSDLHFGDPACSLSSQPVALGLRSFLWGLGDVRELILAGDIPDANISSLHTAIEGRNGSGPWPKQMGFRQWLSFLFENDKFGVESIICIPGNHDYIIWNILSTNKAFVDPISQGNTPTSLPLMEDKFVQPFIRGVAPLKVRDRFIVTYPDYEFDLSGRSVLVIHGHYLDEQQTLFRSLEKLIQAEDDKKEAIRKLFIGTAQYEVVANAVSFMKNSRDLVDKAYKSLSWFFDAIGGSRGTPIDATTLHAVEVYLFYLRNKQPDVYIFGHTHKAGHANTKTLGPDKAKRLLPEDVEVWNDGSFLGSPSNGQAGTFIVTDDNPTTGAPIRLLEVDSKGNVKNKDI
jgi:predicted phosphodiesterase